MSTLILCPGQEDPLEEGLTTHPVLAPRESHGQRKLAGYRPRSHKNFQQDWANNTTFHPNFASDVSESTFIFCPQEPRKPECWSHFHSLGLLRISQTPDTPCPVILNHLLRHCAGKPGHDPNYQDESQTPHPYVLLPQTFVLCWSLLLNSSCTQATRKLGCGRQNHLLHRMPPAVLLCLHVCGDRDVPVGSDGVRQICGHLQPSSLHRCDVSEALLLIGGCIILLGYSLFLDSYLLFIRIVL